MGKRTLFAATTVAALSAPICWVLLSVHAATTTQQCLCTEIMLQSEPGVQGAWCEGGSRRAHDEAAPVPALCLRHQAQCLGFLPVVLRGLGARVGQQGPSTLWTLPGTQPGVLSLQNHLLHSGRDHGPLSTYWWTGQHLSAQRMLRC